MLPSRIQHYQAFASRLRANVFAPDYRGYADSTGTPSEAGLILDARASWDWLRCPEVHRKVVGGTSRERPRGVVLLAPFSSVETLLDSYYIAGFVPLFAPIRIFPSIASKS